jgi:serine protease AprX
MKHVCALCGQPHDDAELREVDWLSEPVLKKIADDHPGWKHEDGGCAACVQDALLHVLLERDEEALHHSIQAHYPLDAEAAFGAIPTPLRMHADPRYTGKGVTIALVDSGFYPHPDLVQPRNRIRAWVDAGKAQIQTRTFLANETPSWTGWNKGDGWQWHGMMTSTVAAGNGYLSHGLYRGLASDAEIVLIQARQADGAITNASITHALHWILEHRQEFNIRVVSLSLGGDPVSTLRANPVDEAIAELVAQGVIVVAAAGNNGERRLIPPATAPAALTVGGIDDQNMFNDDEIELWHSNYGEGDWGVPKPEVVAPSIWVVAPVLPVSEIAEEAQWLFDNRRFGDEKLEARLAELKLVTPHYQHVDGTSFAAPLVASIAACMLQANPALTPALVREILMNTAHPVPDVPRERQGAGAVHAGRAVALALRERHKTGELGLISPEIAPEGVTFLFHHHQAGSVRVLGSWDEWSAPGVEAVQIEPGIWHMQLPALRAGQYAYKFRVDDAQWADDPINPHKAPDGFGGLNSVFIVSHETNDTHPMTNGNETDSTDQ